MPRLRVSRWVPLAVLTVLGLLTMHSTPMTAMGSPGTSHDAAMHATAGMPPSHTVMPEPSSNGPRLTDQLSRRGGQGSPAQHLTMPCLSNGARGSVTLAGGPTATTSGGPSALVSLTVRSTSVGATPNRAPPDLQELCISRT